MEPQPIDREVEVMSAISAHWPGKEVEHDCCWTIKTGAIHTLLAYEYSPHRKSKCYLSGSSCRYPL